MPAPLTNLTNFMTPAILMALKAIQIFNICYSRNTVRTVTHTHRIQRPKPIVIGFHPMLYLPLHREFLPLQTAENVKTTQQGEVGHVNASGSLRLS
jgi:hypothetical protein